MPSNNSPSLAAAKLVILIVAGVIALAIVGCVGDNMITTVNANEIVVKQDWIGGQLHVWYDPGIHWQNFGTLTRYKRSSQFWFSAREDEGKKTDDAIQVRFSDGGQGKISGSLRYALPTDPNRMLDLHRNFHSQEAIDHELIQQVVNKGVYMSGPLMSSRESYAEKRADLIAYITDQIEYGVYKTDHETVKMSDPITGQMKDVDILRPKYLAGAPNGIERQEVSPLQRYDVVVSNITVNGIEYDPTVEKQIAQQQAAIMSVQQAIVNAKKAEQDTLTVEQQGKAEAAKAKWDQEVKKATAVTAAEQDKAVAVTQAEKDKAVAALALQTAKLNAQQEVTEATADAKKARLQLQANNYFEDRLNAYVSVEKAWADAYGSQKQVPDISMGGQGATCSSSPLNAAMEALSIKAMRDLQVNPKP